MWLKGLGKVFSDDSAIERRGTDRIDKRVYIGPCGMSLSKSTIEEVD